MRAVLCPVCNGFGKVASGFYNRSGESPYWVSSGGNPEVCRGCNGTGWVEVAEIEPLSEVLNQLKGIYNQAVDLGVLETMLREYIEGLKATVDKIKEG